MAPHDISSGLEHGEALKKKGLLKVLKMNPPKREGEAANP